MSTLSKAGLTLYFKHFFYSLSACWSVSWFKPCCHYFFSLINIHRSSVWSLSFTYTEDQNYGPYLESVNGLAGNDTEHTYWELLVNTPDGEVLRPDVGAFTQTISALSLSWCSATVLMFWSCLQVLGVTFRMQMRPSYWILQRGEDSPTTVRQHEAKGSTSAPTDLSIYLSIYSFVVLWIAYLWQDQVTNSATTEHLSCFWLWQRMRCFRCMFWVLIYFHCDFSLHQLCRSLSIWAEIKASCISEFNPLSMHPEK